MGHLTRAQEAVRGEKKVVGEKKRKKEKKTSKQTKRTEHALSKSALKKVQLPDQLVVDIQLEFGMKVGKTDTERGPVMRRKDREEVVNRRAVSKK